MTSEEQKYCKLMIKLFQMQKDTHEGLMYIEEADERSTGSNISIMHDIEGVIKEDMKEDSKKEREETHEIEYTELYIARAMIEEAEKESIVIVEGSEAIVDKLEEEVHRLELLLQDKENRIVELETKHQEIVKQYE